MTTTLMPTTDLVVRAWLTGLGLNAGPVLPQNESAWKDTGFVRHTTVAGSPEIYTSLRRPLVQLDFWAINPGSNKAPWNQANALAETVLAASYIASNFETVIDLPGDYASARLLSTYFIDEPRRISDQSNDAARYMAQMQLAWVIA